MQKAEGVKADGLVKNGLPRVAWEGVAKNGRKVRIVLTADVHHAYGTRSARPLEAMALEVAIKSSALGTERWQGVGYVDDATDVTWPGAWVTNARAAIQAFVGQVMCNVEPLCIQCLDAGRVDEGCANGDGLKPPCPKCERGQQVAEARR